MAQAIDCATAPIEHKQRAALVHGLDIPSAEIEEDEPDRLLIVDDDAPALNRLPQALTRDGSEAAAGTGLQGVTAPESKSPGLWSSPLDTNTNFYIITSMKPIDFRGDSLDALRAFPEDARREAGHQIDKIQRGQAPDDWKPMAGIGPGVKEIRVWDEAGTFRVIYLAKLADAVYVPHCFQKKSEQTSEKDIKLARKRFKELIEEQK